MKLWTSKWRNYMIFIKLILTYVFIGFQVKQTNDVTFETNQQNKWNIYLFLLHSSKVCSI